MARYGERTRLIPSNTSEKNISAWFGQAQSSGPATTDILVIAGGGSGSYGSYAGAGGGAGGYLEYTAQLLTTAELYAVTVGAGASAPGLNAIGNNGNNSSFGTLPSAIAGGGAGGGTSGAANNGRAGGSGGGGATNDTSGGGVTVGGAGTAGPPRQGYNGGGNGNFTAPPFPSGGGGGAGAVGQTAPGSTTSGNGGIGISTPFINEAGVATTSGQLSGGNYYFAGGGGGANHVTGTSGTGGLGGGGNGGQYNSTAGVSGTTNTGGGGGSGTQNTIAGAGGSGIVIARYLGDQRAYGGTITSSGGYTYHKYTSSGNFYNSLSLPVSGAALWLDASVSSSFTYSTGTKVSQWSDLSGNNRNFTQATAANQPTRNTNIQNGLPGVIGTPNNVLSSSYNWVNSAFTTFIVVKPTNTSGFMGWMGAHTTIGCPALGTSNSAGEYSLFRTGISTNPSNLVATLSNADVAVWKSSGVSGGNVSATIYKNGTQSSTNPGYGSSTTGTIATLFASSTGFDDPCNGYIFEVIVYPTQLSDTDRIKVEKYLQAKWGTP